MPPRTLLLTPLLLALTACAGAQAGPVERTFHKIVLEEEAFYAEGATAGDLNGDGILDFVYGPYWYAGPDFQQRHEYYEPSPFDPEQYSDNFFAYVYDFDGDGWQDIFIIHFPGEEASWYRNPGEETGAHWERHIVMQGVDNESPTFLDLTGDGRPELVCIHQGRYGYARPDWSDPAAPWTFHPISEDGGWQRYTHGLGVGDVNGDGRLDVLDKDGWWEQPASLEGEPVWRRHEADFGGGGAQMYVYDFDGDGLNDVVTSLDAHGYGLAWYRQLPGAEEGDSPRFEQQLIMGDASQESPYGVRFTQIHAVELADMDGDGVQDIVAGKRYWAHGSTGDPEPDAPAVIYWFRTVRDGAGGVSFEPHLIDDDSGVGVQVVVEDVNGDGHLDVVIGNKRMAAVLLQQVE